MENFQRYKTQTEKSYNKKTISYYLMRKPCDRIIIPYLNKIRGEEILEVGIGFGYYKDIYYNQNKVTGYDINPDMGAMLGIQIIAGKAEEIRNIKKKYNRVLSFFMTEYLSPGKLREFIEGGLQLVSPGGVFATTIILKSGLGRFYTSLATIKGIRKYSYAYEEIQSLAHGYKHEIIPLNSYCGIPFAVLLEIQL